MSHSRRLFQPVDILSDEEVDGLHTRTLEILRHTGVVMRCPQARAILQNEGAQIEGEVCRFDPELVQAKLALAPSSFTLAARDPKKSVVVGEDTMVRTPTYGATHIVDRSGRRRPAILADLQRLQRRVQNSEVIDNVGAVIVKPTDIPSQCRHLHILRSILTQSDKSFMAVTTSRDPSVSRLRMADIRARDSIEMARIALGPGFDRQPHMVAVATCNSALTWEAASCGVIRSMAEAGQAAMIAPFSIAGANAPTQSSKLLLQLNAEILAAVVYAQTVRPGSAVVYGPYATTMDPVSEKSMAGTPDIVLYTLAFGQLARRYRLPYRGGGLFHVGGWLEGGMTVDECKMLLDFEELRKIVRLERGLLMPELQASTPGLIAFKHEANYSSEGATAAGVYQPNFADHRGYDDWIANGKQQATGMASQAMQEGAANAVPLSEDRVAALDEFIRQRESYLK